MPRDRRGGSIESRAARAGPGVRIVVREFEDAEGRGWDVVLGRASWGAFHALFVPRDGGTVRESLLEVEAADEAARHLHSAGPKEIEALFERSVPRQDN